MIPLIIDYSCLKAKPSIVFSFLTGKNSILNMCSHHNWKQNHCFPKHGFVSRIATELHEQCSAKNFS